MNQENSNMEIADLGGGCFWCLEAVYDELEGVQQVVSGYEGGQLDNPTYKQICSGNTGHAEIVRVTFDPTVVSFDEILRVFFTIHDPTSLNRQGADRGTQYRSVIFYHDQAQKETAEKLIAELNADAIWPNPIVTEVALAQTFYPAEDYHQDYYANNSYQPYCQVVINPKLAKFRQKYATRLKTPQP
jgi:peptide-methionine (S)-S-oxide reductase